MVASVPNGIKLLKEWNLTVNEGWWLKTGRTISAAYYRPQNILFTSGGVDIQLKQENYGGLQFTSGEMIWDKSHSGGVQIPCYFYARIRARLGQKFGVGDFPAFYWFRGQDGVCEIDGHESLGGHIADPKNSSANQKLMDHKVTMTSTPYTERIDESKELKYSLVKDDPVQGCTNWHTYELYKTPGQLLTYLDGKLATEHYRDQKAGKPKPKFTVAKWNEQFENRSRLHDLRISYQYGDDPDGSPKGNAGPAQPFTGVKHLYVAELVVGVPS